MSAELQASGIDAEVSESDTIIEDLIGKEDAAVDSGKDEKKKEKLTKRQLKNKDQGHGTFWLVKQEKW